MNRERDFDQTLARWLDDGADQAPERIVWAALEETERIAQRGARQALLEGLVMKLKAGHAAGCINWGFPTIADTDIPEVLPTGVCTYEHVVANVLHDDMPSRSIEIRGLKVTRGQGGHPAGLWPGL